VIDADDFEASAAFGIPMLGYVCMHRSRLIVDQCRGNT
jgi:hypothetical protein